MSRKGQIYLIGFVITLLSGLLYREHWMNSQPLPLVQQIANEVTIDDPNNSYYMQQCIEIALEQPGDIAFAKKHGWQVVCVDSGNPYLGYHEANDSGTMAFVDPSSKIIYVNSYDAEADVLVHEAAHILADVAFADEQKENFAKQLGKQKWRDTKDYWNTPSESFAESRSGCLGYGFDVEFKKMDCETQQQMIDQSELADEIKDLEKRAEE